MRSSITSSGRHIGGGMTQIISKSSELQIELCRASEHWLAEVATPLIPIVMSFSLAGRNLCQANGAGVGRLSE